MISQSHAQKSERVVISEQQRFTKTEGLSCKKMKCLVHCHITVFVTVNLYNECTQCTSLRGSIKGVRFGPKLGQIGSNRTNYVGFVKPSQNVLKRILKVPDLSYSGAI